MSRANEMFTPKRGYLDENFCFFNLQDTQETKIKSHYHDFNKIVIFISGQVTYYIEGTAYPLKPWDVLLIDCHTIHKPVIDSAVPYDRIILWFRPSFLQQHSQVNCNLNACFERTRETECNLLRFLPDRLARIQTTIAQIKATCPNAHFGDELLRKSLILQLLVYINRAALNSEQQRENEVLDEDVTVRRILHYIDEHLAEDLSAEKLSSIALLSKYYLMHKFKMHTGYSLHNYILQKRLIAANQFMRQGQSVTSACMNSGFHDYSNFTRVFKKNYGLSPKQYQKSMR